VRVWVLGLEGRRTQFELALLKEEGCQEEARPGSWIMDVRLWSGPRARGVLVFVARLVGLSGGFGLARAREVFWGPEGRRDLVILFFSPRIRADMSAALVDTEEN
jgi:hypothetical protein